MASGTQKVVEFALKLTGVDPKALTPLVTGFQNLDKVIKTTQTSVNNFQKSLNKLKAPANFKTLARDLEKLGKVKLKDLGPLATNLQKLSKIKKLPNIGTFVNNVAKLASSSFAGLGVLAKNLRAIAKINVEATVSKIRALNTALRALEKQGGLASLSRFATDIRSMRSALDNSKASVNQITDSLHKVGNSANSAGIKMRTFSDKIRTVMEFRLISEGLVQLKIGITNGIAAIIEYDQALKDLQAITSATSTEVSQMGAKILEVASSTKFSASEVAAGMRTLGQAGFTASESVLTMQGVSDLATGTLSAMAQTVDLVTTAMRVFQVDASQSSTVTDTFANAVNRSKLTVDKLRTSMNYVGPIAKDANVSFQELSAAMMTLANSGIRASTIGTSLRRVFAQLVAPSKKLRNAASEVGVALQDIDPTTKGLSHVLNNLRIVLKDTGTAFDIFGKRGASAALALTAQGSQYNDLLSTVSKTGTAAEMAEIQMEGLGVSFKNLRDKLGLLAISFGEGGVAGAMRVFVDYARIVVDFLNELSQTTIGGLVIQISTLITILGILAGSFIGLQSAISGTVIATFASTVVSLTKSVWAAVLAQNAWNLAIKANPIAAVFGAIALVVSTTIALFGDFGDSADDAAAKAAILASKYGDLDKKVTDYNVSVVSLDKDSEELKNTNLRLRKQMIETSKSNLEIADSAREVANAIDPLNGAFTNSVEILEEYQEKLNNLKYDQLIEASNKATLALQKDLNAFERVLSRFVESVKRDVFLVNDYLVAIWEAGLNLLDGSSTIFKDWSASMDEIRKKMKSFSETSLLSKQLRADTVNFKELQRTIAGWGDTLTSEQAQIKKEFETLVEYSQSLLNHWRETGKVSLDIPTKAFKKLAEEVTTSELQLEVLLGLFKQAQEARGPANIFEKWNEDPSSMLVLNNIRDFEAAYKEFGGVISDVQMQELLGAERNRKALLKSYNKLKENIPSPDATEEEWTAWVAKVRGLITQVESEMAQFSKNEMGQLINAFNAAQADVNQRLKENEQTYKGHAEALARNADKINNDFTNQVEEIFGSSVEKIGTYSKVIADDFKSDVNSMSENFSELEKEAEKTWKNIPKHADNSLNAQQAAMGNWLSTIQNEMTEFSNTTNKTLGSLGDNLQAALKAGAKDEVFQNILEAIENVTTEGADYYEQMGDSIDSVLDHLASKEAELLDNIEEYAQQALDIQKQVSDFISDLEQKQMDEREKFADNRIKAEEAFRQAAIKTAEAERVGGEKGIELRKEANKFVLEGLKLAEKIGSSVQNRDSIEEKIKKSKEKELEISKEINSLDSTEDADKVNRLTKQRTDEIQKQKDLQDELNLSEEKERVAKKLALQAEKETEEYKKAQIEASDALVKSVRDQTEEFKTLKERAEEAAKIIENISLDVDTEVAIANINAAVGALDDFKEPIPITLDFSVTDTIGQKIKDMGKDIVQVGNTWTNTWTQAVGGSTQEVKDFETALKELEGSKVKVIFDGSGSSTKPITEKIAEIKSKFEELVIKLTEEIQVHITLPTYSDVMSKLQSIVDKLAEIKSKEITITADYRSTGDSSPEGKQTGGGLPGYGGGDKIPLLAEAGEWIIRKEAVKKFGSSFFASLNSLRVPKFQMGGAVSSVSRNEPKLASEMMTVRFQAGGVEMPLNVTGRNSSTRQQIRDFGIELKKMGLANG